MIYKRVPATLNDLWSDIFIGGITEDCSLYCISCLIIGRYEGSPTLVTEENGLCEGCGKKVQDSRSCECNQCKKVKGS